MKKLLLASAAALLAGTSAIALDGVANPVVEIRGDDGARTLHISDGATNTRINIGGQTVEIQNGTVIVDGESFELDGAQYVVIDGDDVQLVDGREHGYRFEFSSGHHALGERMADMARNLNYTVVTDFDHDFDFDHDALVEMAEELANMETHFAAFERVDFEEIHADAMRSMEEALANLDEGNVRVDGRDWDELSDAEKEEVREELREAREEMRVEMRSMREEMRDAAREMRHAERERERAVRMARREVERAHSRAERDARRERHAERRAHAEDMREHAEEMRAHAERMHIEVEHARDIIRQRAGDDASIRVIEDEDGNRRVWVNGEEQTGDDLTDWLNELEADRLEGGN